MDNCSGGTGTGTGKWSRYLVDSLPLHVLVLYGLMAWNFWSHVAGTVLFTLAGIHAAMYVVRSCSETKDNDPV